VAALQRYIGRRQDFTHVQAAIAALVSGHSGLRATRRTTGTALLLTADTRPDDLLITPSRTA